MTNLFSYKNLQNIVFINFNKKFSLKILYLIFFFSGISALIYQVTWQRLLTIHYGVGAVSITLIVSIYMLGLGFGSLLGGRLAEKFPNNSIHQYFLIELGIGIFGLLSFPLIMTIGNITAGSSYALTFFYNFLLLLIPTMLMGMALPILVKVFNRFIPDLSRSLSRLYFINTLGAALGTVMASYILISFYGIDAAIYTAAAINIVLALGILTIRKSLSTINLPKDQNPENYELITDPISPYTSHLVFLTGFIAIGYELIWFRIISVLVKSSPYAFTSSLAIYLLGVAMGSLIIGKIIKRLPLNQRSSLFYVLQILLAISVAIIFIGYYYATLLTPVKSLTEISFSLPIHPPFHFLRQHIHFQSTQKYLVFLFRLGTTLFWPMFFIFIPTLFIGATFPIIAGLGLKKNTKIAWHIGKIYFFNITGNVLGAIVTGFVLLPYLGTERTILLFVLIGLSFAIPLLIKKKYSLGYIGLAIILGLTCYFFPKRGALYAVIHPKLKGYAQYFSEGVSGVIMTYVSSDGRVENYINGDSHGGRPGYSFYAQVIAAASYAKKTDHILVIGYGTGSIVEGALKIPEVKKVTLVELNQTLLTNLRRIPLFNNLLSDPRLEIVVEDARRFLKRETGVYDLVFMNPLRASSAYSNNIYSQQFFELVSLHLTEQGILIAWSDALDSTFRTLDKVFPYNELHVKNLEGFFLASHDSLVSNPIDTLVPILGSFDYPNQKSIIATCQGFKIVPKESMQKIANRYLPVQDWRPNSEYYIGLWFHNSWRVEK